jgi:hypothetical protein
MGFFDRFTGKKSQPAPTATSSAAETTEPTSGAAAAAVGAVKPRLAAARERLQAQDVAGAVAIYEEVLAGSGDRADVLVAVSGDLGSHGQVAQIVELVAPRYVADRHGPATGLNLLQAYLALRDPDAAQHVLDLLFSLNRPELEDRLHGFSNAIAEMLASPLPLAGGGDGPGAPGADIPQVAMISISKPIWFYGLDAMAAQLLPPKEGRLRRIAFAQLALPGYPDAAQAMTRPEDEMGRLARAIPLWLAETFYFSAAYNPIAAVGVLKNPKGAAHPVIFAAEWSTENVRQLVESTSEGLDYVITGALRSTAGDFELVLRIWEVKGFRERKMFNVRWTPASMDEALGQIHAQLRSYMEWSPASAAFAFTPAAQPAPWIDALGASLGLFLVEKNILPPETLPPVDRDLTKAAARASLGEAASFAYLTMKARAQAIGHSAGGDVALARSVLVNAARGATGV